MTSPMTSRLITIAAAVLLHLGTVSLVAQTTQTLSQPTAQTRQQLTKALQEYREKQDLHGEAITLLQLGITEAGLGNIDGARSKLAEAVKKMRAQNDFVGTWVGLLTASQIEVALRHFPEALPHLEKALIVLNEAKTSTAPFSVKTFTALGTATGFSFQLPQGLNESSMTAMKPMLIQFSLEPVTHDLYGSVLTQVGQYEKAEAELKAASAGSIYSQGMYDFSIESHFGDLRLRQQRYDEARAHYVKAVNASSKMAQIPMGGQQIKADLYSRLARLETITGHPEEAKRWSEKARDLAAGSRTENQ